MENNKALAILKAFYLGTEDMNQIARRTKASRDEVREVLKGARDCGLIEYRKDTLAHAKHKKLGNYLRTKGAIK